jgi:prepilin-type N-terminal cleavage/methylation domain-containing protein
MNLSSANGHRAFTLAEMLIAVSITLIIVVLLSRIFGAAASQWQAADQRMDAFRDARAALQLMNRDLGRAITNGDPQMLTLSNLTGSWYNEAYAVAPMSNSGKSSLCAVGYYLNWDGNTKTYTLKRMFKDSDATNGLLQGSSPNFGSLYSHAAANDEDLVSYAWDLRFSPGFQGDPLNPPNGPSTQWHWIEIRFKAMSAQAARKLKNLPIDQNTWKNPGDTNYKNLILPNEQQFVTRVNLQQTH